MRTRTRNVDLMVAGCCSDAPTASLGRKMRRSAHSFRRSVQPANLTLPRASSTEGGRWPEGSRGQEEAGFFGKLFGKKS